MSESIDRRRFLGSAAIGVAASGLSVSAKSTAKYDSPNTRVVVGIMGMSRGRRLAESFGQQPNVHIKYVCDVDSLRLDKVARTVEQQTGRAPQKSRRLQANPGRSRGGRPAQLRAQPLARPGHHPGLFRRQARLRGETVQPHPPRGRTHGRRRAQVQPGGPEWGPSDEAPPEPERPFNNCGKGPSAAYTWFAPGTTAAGAPWAGASRCPSPLTWTTTSGRDRPPVFPTRTT